VTSWPGFWSRLCTRRAVLPRTNTRTGQTYIFTSFPRNSQFSYFFSDSGFRCRLSKLNTKQTTMISILRIYNSLVSTAQQLDFSTHICHLTEHVLAAISAYYIILSLFRFCRDKFTLLRCTARWWPRYRFYDKVSSTIRRLF
jgi:hypothetical protein